MTRLKLKLLAKLPKQLLGDKHAQAHGLDAHLEHRRHYIFGVAELDRRVDVHLKENLQVLRYFSCDY